MNRDLIDFLRGVLLPSGFSDNRLSDGVLYDSGITLWEMPAGSESGGYSNAVGNIANDQSEWYRRALTVAARQNAFTRDEFQSIASELFDREYSALNTDADDYFANYVGRGSNSIAHQNTFFAPKKIVGSNPSRFYPFAYPRLAEIVKLVEGNAQSLYLEIGFVNNGLAPVNDFELSVLYPLIERGSYKHFDLNQTYILKKGSKSGERGICIVLDRGLNFLFPALH
ncbi:MAG: hypothetical protein ACKV2T_25860 [Kofleriaceae bacterium]